MQQGLQTFSIKKFQGVRNWENEQNIPANYLFYAQNSEINGGRWRSGKGCAAYLPALTSGTQIRNLTYYPYSVAGVETNYIVENYNNVFYLINTDTDSRSVVAGTTFTHDEDVGSVVYNNQLYVVSPQNGMAWMDGSTWSTTFVGTPPPGSMLETHAEKIWTAGVLATPSVIFYSRSATAGNPEYARDWTTGSGSALVGKGGRITALRSLKNVLYVFKTDSVYYLSSFDSSGAYPIPIFTEFSVTAGCVNKDCAVLVENDIWFLTPKLEIRSLGSAENFLGDPRTYDVSLAIKRYLQQLDPDQSGATMSYFNKVLKISLKTIGSPVNNLVLTYDTNDQNFQIDRLASAKLYVSTAKQRFFSEDGQSGTLYKDSIGYTQNGSSFSWNGKTVMMDLGQPKMQKRLRYITIYLGRSLEQTVYIKLYKDSYSTTPTIYTLQAPTSTETGAVVSSMDGFGGNVVGGSVWGGAGMNISVSDEPNLYRRIFVIDVSQIGYRFGIEAQATINGGLVEIEQIDFQYIRLPDKNKQVDI